MSSTRSRPHCQKNKKKKSSNIKPTYVQTLHILSTNIVALALVTNPAYHQTITQAKSITYVENFLHLYSRAKIETLNKAKMYFMIKPKGFVKLSLTRYSPTWHHSRTCCILPLPSLLSSPHA